MHNLTTRSITALFCLSFLTLGINSCRLQTKEDTGLRSDYSTLAEGHRQSFELKDSMLARVSEPVTGKQVVLDSRAGPVRKAAGQSRTSSYSTNVRRAGSPKIVPLTDELPVFTPGLNGTSIPTSVPASGKIGPAAQPRPVAAALSYLKNDPLADFQHWNTEEGLSSMTIHAVCEDGHGNIWIGSGGGGVSRFDGYSLTHYSEAEGLLYSSIHSLLVDSRGDLWIGTDGKGLSHYNGQYFTHYTDREGLSDNTIEVIFEDNKGNIWFGTRGGGANKLEPLANGGQGRFTHYTTKTGLSHNSVKAIAQDKAGNLWFGTENGVNRYDGREFTHLEVEQGLSSNVVQAIAVDEDGSLWFGTAGGLNRYDGRSIVQYTAQEGLSHDFIQSMLLDSRGHLWLGMGDGSANKFDPDAFAGQGSFARFGQDEGMANGQIFSIIEDRKGFIWFGVQGDGLYRYNSSSFTYNNYLNGFFLEDSDGKLLTDQEGVLSRCDLDQQTVTRYGIEGLRGNTRYSSVLEDSQGNIWTAIYGEGVRKFDGEEVSYFTKDNVLTDDAMSVMIEDSRGNIWMATHTKGVARYHPTEKRITHFTEAEGLVHDHLHALLEDSRGRIWIGSGRAGLSLYQPDEHGTGGTFTNLTKREGLSGDQINTMMEDSKGNIWIGTWNGGISIFHPTDHGGTFTYIDQQDGLSNNIIQSILEDKWGRYWVSTEQGLNVLIPDSTAMVSGGFRIINFSEQDGVKPVNTGGGFIDRKDRLWWGGMMLDLNIFELSEEAPGLQLTELELEQSFVDYRRVALDTAYRNSLPFGKYLNETYDSVASFYNYPLNLTLPYHLNHLTFTYAGIGRTPPYQMSYQFMLEGLDEDWNPITSENKADYRNLPQGHYTFKMRAAGHTMRWSEPFAYPFTILPPWWQTWWAYLLYALIIAGLFLAVRQYELKRLYIQTEARRLKELDSVKTRLYTNITHEFRTPLTIILGMAEEVLNDPEHWFREGLKMIRRNGQNLLRLVNQMLDLSKLESGALPLHLVQGDVVAYFRYLTESFRSLAESENIQLEFHADLDGLYMDYDPDKLLHILSNLLSNAIKFTPEGGRVDIVLSATFNNRQIAVEDASSTGRDPAQLLLEVKDTGIGIAAEKLPHIFDRFYQTEDAATRWAEGTGIGLALTRELVKLSGGTIAVESSLGKGSQFKVHLPIRNQAPLTDQTDSIGMEQSIATFSPIPQNDLSPDAARMQEKDEAPLLLIIEDNPDVVRYLSGLLGGDYRLQVAGNGRDGVQKALAIIPDMVISDVMMPEMDGFEVCNTLKQDERTSHIPIILLTAKADVTSRIAGLKRGADDYLAKPFNKQELFVRLQNLIEQRRRLQARFADLQLQALPGSDRPNPEEKDLKIEDAFLQKVRNLILEHLSDEQYGIEQLCGDLGISRVQLHRKLKALTDQSTSHYIRAIRLRKGKELLQNTDLNVSQVAYEVGFKHPSYFARLFSEQFGISPKEVK